MPSAARHLRWSSGKLETIHASPEEHPLLSLPKNISRRMAALSVLRLRRDASEAGLSFAEVHAEKSAGVRAEERSRAQTAAARDAPAGATPAAGSGRTPRPRPEAQTSRRPPSRPIRRPAAPANRPPHDRPASATSRRQWRGQTATIPPTQTGWWGGWEGPAS